MEKKLPEVFKNRIDKEVKNNKDVYYTRSTDKVEEKVSQTSFTRNVDGKNIEQKIQSIFSSPTYVYKADVELVLNDGSKLVKKIIGKNVNHLITMDNELIPITSVKDIHFK